MRPELSILHADNHLLALAKPAGLPTVPDESGDASLLDLAREWVRVEFAKPGEVFLGVVHRLDRPVSGVVLFARTSKGASRLSQQFRARTVQKVYWAVGEGEPVGDAGILEQWLEKDARTNRVFAADAPRPGAAHARTAWRVLERADGRTLYELRPETGRPHQLRLCARSLGTPLCGDLKYGAREPLSDRSIALHARSLEVDHPTRAERLRFEAPVPGLPVWQFARTDGS
jgi:23S rRNA pseudouridine1911/1915/1917 synthase